MIVVDASALAAALGQDGSFGGRARERLRGETLVAPELIDLEVAAALRRLSLGGRLPVARAELALLDLLRLPLRRLAHRPLIGRCWELRDNLTVYDAAYVALAEGLRSTLVTADARLAKAPGPCCEVELVSASA